VNAAIVDLTLVMPELCAEAAGEVPREAAGEVPREAAGEVRVGPDPAGAETVDAEQPASRTPAAAATIADVRTCTFAT